MLEHIKHTDVVIAGDDLISEKQFSSVSSPIFGVQYREVYRPLGDAGPLPE
jgi:hypothetical protein